MQPGTTIGAYEILSTLGAGGMGEVYRARDTTLQRDVAIKLLPASVAHDAERRARFTREAQVLAAFNHPHIGAIYGVVQQDSVHALVLELIDGPTLADLIAAAPFGLPLDEALPIARQIADALEAAHDNGIIHRDLKPANIKVRPDGTVKVLDFGLAKMAEPAGPPPDAAQSPTITTPGATAAGIILGTAAYMSPEQAKGRPTDKRSDIWAFGCVFYEMLTGGRAFQGGDVAETLAEVIKGAPDWTRLPRLPRPLRLLLERALEKDRSKRLSDASSIQLLLSEPDLGSEVPHSESRRPALFAWSSAALLIGVAVGALAFAAVRGPEPGASPAPVLRYPIIPPEGQSLGAFTRQLVAISRDGSQIAFVFNNQIFLQRTFDDAPIALAGTEVRDGIGVNSPSFSPDGRWLAFFSPADNTIKRVSVNGGTALTVTSTTQPFGITWTDYGIVYGHNTGVWRVSAESNAPARLVQASADEFVDSPQILPGSDDVLFTLAKGRDADRWDKASVVVQSLSTAKRTVVLQNASAAYLLPTGHLIFARSGVLFAAPFDHTSDKTIGNAVPVIEGVRRSLSPAGSGVAHYAVSDNGVLVFWRGAARSLSRSLAVIDRAGKATPLRVPQGWYSYPRASRDGSTLAVQKDDGDDANVWVYNLKQTGQIRRLTFDGRNRFPIWSADGQRVTFQSDRQGDAGIFWQRATGADSGAAARLTRADKGTSHIPEAWSPDGRTLLYSVRDGDVYRLWSLDRDTGRSTPYGALESAEPIGAVFSPDGRWVAYAYNERAGGQASLNRGVYIQPFPFTGEVHQMPKDQRDFHPTWSPDGTSLLYVPTVGRLSSVAVTRHQTIAFDRPSALPLSTAYTRLSTEFRDYDVLPNGSLVMVTVEGTEQSAQNSFAQLRVVVNWFEELKQLAPIGNR